MKAICHYSEIGLKGRNRSFFEKKLVSNIKKALPKNSYKNVRRISGRIIVDLVNGSYPEKELKKVFGIANFSFARKVDSKLSEIEKVTLNMIEKLTANCFRVTTKRSDKSFPVNSLEVSRIVGAKVAKKTGWKVDLEDYDLNIFIEITKEEAFVYTKKIEGYGGLPVKSSGRATLLLSGGIDSPVAGFKMLKRGLKLNFVHFHAYPIVSDDSIKKAEKLFEILKSYSPDSKLFLMPFGNIQKKIKVEIPERFRIIFYRRAMFKIAEKISEKNRAKALVTGESLGQVSSQTLPNMRATEQAVKIPVLRPLVGENKQEIILKAKEIETYPISILPDQDCCTLFNPKNPETNADLEEVLKIDKELDLKTQIKDCIKNKEVLT